MELLYSIGALFYVLGYWFFSGWSWISFFTGAVAGIGGLWLLAEIWYG